MTSEELREARDTLQQSQQELATTLGVAKNTVSRWERGTLAVPKYVAAYLASTLAVCELFDAIEHLRSIMKPATVEAIPLEARNRLDAAIKSAVAVIEPT